MTEQQTNVIALVRDLIFVSRISATARAAGTSVKLVRNPGDLRAAMGRLLIVDLNLDGATEAAAEWQKENSPSQVVAFVSHVDAETIARARSLGIEKILARSRFVEILPDLIANGLN